MKKLILTVVGAFSLTTLLTWATTVRTVNIFDMVALSDRVFWGKCISVEDQVEESTDFPIVQYAFEVRQGIKGVHDGQTVIFRQAGLASKGGIAGVPQYQKGQEVLLFLHGDSDSGLTSPVGLAQGAFRLEKRQDRQIGVINSLHNRNLGYHLGIEEVRESGLTTQDLEQIHKPEPIPLRVLSDVVHKIQRYHGRKGRMLR